MKESLVSLYFVLLLLILLPPTHECFSKQECLENSHEYARVHRACVTADQQQRLVTIELAVHEGKLHLFHQNRTGVLVAREYTDGFMRTFIANSLYPNPSTGPSTLEPDEYEEPDPARRKREAERLSGVDSCENSCKKVSLVDVGGSIDPDIEYFTFFTTQPYNDSEAGVLETLKKSELRSLVKERFGVEVSGMYEGWPARERKLSLSSGHIIGIIIAIICLLIILIAIFVLCLKRINRKELPLMDPTDEKPKVREGDIVPM